jgi:hypothetical protein
MELQHRILQFNNSPKYELLKTKFQKLDCHYQFNENGSLSSIEYVFSEHAPYASELINYAQQNDIMLQSALHYEEEEILSAEWVIAEVGEFQYPQPEDNYVEATYNTQNYCGRCGQGKKQDRPFRLKKDFSQKQAQFLGLHWVFDEIFVRPMVISLFNSAGISGVKYLDVIHYKTNQPFGNVFQLDIPIIEEAALITDNLFSVTCKSQNEESFVKGIGQLKDRLGASFCGRVKYHYPLTEPIKFKANVLKGLPDFIKSSECYGSGAEANHFILVRNRVVRFIKEKKIKGIRFRRPIHLV